MLQLVVRTGAPVDVSKSLADVIMAVEGIQHLSKGRRCDLKTACRTIARIMDRPPSGIAVDLAMIREALEGTMPAQHGLTEKRWSSIRSDFLGALRLTGIAEPLATSKAVLSDRWSTFLDNVKSRDYMTGMSRFARFCSLKDINPAQVNDQVLQAFATALMETTLVTRPGQILRKTARCWNVTRGVGAVAIGAALTVQSNRPPLKRVPLTAMPESFRQDLDAWLKGLEASDPFAADARVRPLRPVTISGYRDRVVSAVAAAVGGGISLDSITSLMCLVEIDTYKAILSYRHKMTESRPSLHTQAIATVLLILAKTRCQAPPAHIEELKKLRAKLPALKQGMVEKNRKLLNAFEDPHKLAGFLAISDKLWRKAASAKTTPARRLVAAQLSLLFDIVTVVPLRLKNLSGLSFKDNLSWPRGPKGPVLLFVPGVDMKNGEDYTAELPVSVAQRLLTYRTKLAPEVLGHVPEHVFVTLHGKCKTMTTVAVEFKAVVARELGIKMTPHQTRHLAAKIILDAHPEAYPLVQQLLGHSNLSTTIKAYAGVNTRRASRSYAKRTRISIISSWRRWLGWIQSNDPTAMALAPAERITPDRVKEFTKGLAVTNRALSVANALRFLRNGAQLIDPSRDWQWLNILERRFIAQAGSSRRPPIPFNGRQLLDLGLDLMEKAVCELAVAAASPDGHVPKQIAVDHRDGLLLAILAVFPLRRSNVEGLTIGESVVRAGGRWQIRIGGDTVKNHEELDATLPEKLSNRIDEHLEHFRPMIYQSDRHRGLWASAKGRPAGGQALYETFTNRI